MNILEIFRIAFGCLLVLFLPGLVWSYVFFAKKSIDWIERSALSLGLSIALVPLVVFWLNYVFHTKITPLSTCIAIVGLIILAMLIILVRRKLSGRSKDQWTVH